MSVLRYYYDIVCQPSISYVDIRVPRIQMAAAAAGAADAAARQSRQAAAAERWRPLPRSRPSAAHCWAASIPGRSRAAAEVGPPAPAAAIPHMIRLGRIMIA